MSRLKTLLQTGSKVCVVAVGLGFAGAGWAGGAAVQSMASAPATTEGTPVAESTPECVPQASLAVDQDSKKVEAVRVTATGYGAPPPKYYPENQRKLMSMRAAKMDAYRALAETINGLHIWGGTTLGDMVVQKDRYRVFLDAYVRGARIVAVTPSDDGNYETVVDLMIDQDFLNKVLASPTTDPCQTISEQVTFAPPDTPSTFYYSE